MTKYCNTEFGKIRYPLSQLITSGLPTGNGVAFAPFYEKSVALPRDVYTEANINMATWFTLSDGG